MAMRPFSHKSTFNRYFYCNQRKTFKLNPLQLQNELSPGLLRENPDSRKKSCRTRSSLFQLSLYSVPTTKLWVRGITLFFLLSSNLLLQGSILKNYDIEPLVQLRFWDKKSGLIIQVAPDAKYASIHLLTLENKNPGSVTFRGKKLGNPSKS